MRLLQPKGWPAPQGFSHGVVADGTPVFLAGQVGITPAGAFAPDFAGQVEQALHNVVGVLAEAGARPGDLAKLTWYVTDVAEFHASVERLFAIWAKVIGAHLPAMTLVEIRALVAPEAKVEIDAIAVVPRERA
jgi:enamine deaminase RidA (YjgF/YER057c/UK114 family)